MTEPAVLETGQQAPEINAMATGGDQFRLSDQHGRWIAVYFYPRANTPG